MTANVLMIGLDAAESTLIETWASSGRLPNLARLIGNGLSMPLDNSLETLPGAIWPELAGGRSCGKVPLYYHPRQLHTGEAAFRPVAYEDVDPDDYFWVRASDAGRRVAVIDVPQTVPLRRPVNGVQLFEWGLHDRNFSISSDPPEVLDDIRRRFGDHPVDNCDTHGETVAGYRDLLRRLKAGAKAKSAMMLDIMKRESWDLFAGVFGETHCVGHQFWHFLDPSHPAHDATAPVELRDAIAEVYGEIDKGIGNLIAAAGPNCWIFVIASHGMGVYIGGPQLLPEVLCRLGLTTGRDGKLTRGLRTWQRATSLGGSTVRNMVRHMVGPRVIRKGQQFAGSLHLPLESGETTAVAVPNNRCGAIRFNVRGREPYGKVGAGNQLISEMVKLKQSLLALRHPELGEPIVERVVTAAEAFGSDHHPDVPDLMIVFRDDLGVLESCDSDEVGLIEVPLYHPKLPRTGDHTTVSRLWVEGPCLAPANNSVRANVLDIGPTILSLLGVPADDLDGRPIDLVGSATA